MDKNKVITKGGTILTGKLASFELTPDDLALINAQALRALSPDEVFAFRVVACNTLPDRHFERFSAATLEGLAAMYPGKPGVRDHGWKSDNIVARVYAAEVEPIPDMEGEQQLVLRMYIPRTEASAAIISDIETGILREVSVGVAVTSSKCSICGSVYGNCDHLRGGEYDGEICYYILDGAADVYELSFCAVPAQPGAGTTKTVDPDPEPEPEPEPTLAKRLSAALLLRLEENEI